MLRRVRASSRKSRVNSFCLVNVIEALILIWVGRWVDRWVGSWVDSWVDRLIADWDRGAKYFVRS